MQSPSEWLAETDPERVLLFLRPILDPDLHHFDDRKLWLFCVACCRRVWHLMTDERTRRLVEVVERWADGKATDAEWTEAAPPAHAAWAELLDHPWGVNPAADIAHAARQAAAAAGEGLARGEEHFEPGTRALRNAVMVLTVTARATHPYPGVIPESAVQAVLLRCLAGNPFRPVEFNPAWRTPTVQSVAEGIYADRMWERMPVLGDALEDAGCTEAEVLGHCRGGGPHARGCWVVDALLAKEC
jgi:hypothetical protein